MDRLELTGSYDLGMVDTTDNGLVENVILGCKEVVLHSRTILRNKQYNGLLHGLVRGARLVHLKIGTSYDEVYSGPLTSMQMIELLNKFLYNM